MSVIGGPRFALVSTLWNDLLAYYTADNTPNDALGNYNGILTNGATYGTGIINQGFSFDGVDDYVSLPNDTFIPSGDFTISFWVKFNTKGGWIMNFGDYSSGKGILFYQNTNRILSIISNDGIDIIGNVVDNPFYTINTWYHIVLTHKTSTNHKYYVNGNLVQTLVSTKNPTYPSPCPNILGAGGSLSANMNGHLDEIALFNGVVLTDEQITELYNSGAGKQYPN